MAGKDKVFNKKYYHNVTPVWFDVRYDLDMIYSYGSSYMTQEFLLRLGWLATRGLIHYIPDLILTNRILTYIPCYDFYTMIHEVTYRLRIDNVIYNLDRMFEGPDNYKNYNRGTKFVHLSNVYLRKVLKG